MKICKTALESVMLELPNEEKKCDSYSKLMLINIFLIKPNK